MTGFLPTPLIPSAREGNFILDSQDSVQITRKIKILKHTQMITLELRS